MGRQIQVVLADDHAMVRAGLAQLLEDSAGIRVVGQASSGKEAVALSKEKQPDVVVLDYSMPEMDGARVAEILRNTCPKSRVLILTVHENVHYAVKVLEAGAFGFVLKAAAVDELVKGIRMVASGRVYVSPAISEKLTEGYRRKRNQRRGLEALSKREFEVLRLLGSGRKLQDCARSMHVSESTAATYRFRLMQKLNLETTADIIRFALENDIVG